MSMSKRLRISVPTALAVGLLPLLAACGGSSDTAYTNSGSGSGSGANAANDTTTNADGAVQLTVPDGVDDETKKRYITENTIAACMKKAGFSYTPYVATADGDDALVGIEGEDYAAAKKSRAKYGYGNYAATVYPNDPKAPFGNAGGRQGGKVLDPVDNDEKGLTPAQQKAYSEALSGPRPVQGEGGTRRLRTRGVGGGERTRAEPRRGEEGVGRQGGREPRERS